MWKGSKPFEWLLPWPRTNASFEWKYFVSFFFFFSFFFNENCCRGMGEGGKFKYCWTKGCKSERPCCNDFHLFLIINLFYSIEQRVKRKHLISNEKEKEREKVFNWISGLSHILWGAASYPVSFEIIFSHILWFIYHCLSFPYSKKAMGVYVNMVLLLSW